MATDVGLGFTVTFGTSGFTAQITDVNWSGVARESVAKSHHGTTGGKVFQPSDLYDPGEMELEILYDPNSVPPFNQPAETLTYTFSNGATDSVSGFITNMDRAVPMEDMMSCSITIKHSGSISHNNGT